MSTLAKDLMSPAEESGVLVMDGMGSLATEFRRLDDQQDVIDQAKNLLRAMRVRDADGAQALAAETLGY